MLSKEVELAYYEEVKDIYLHPNLFSADNGLLSKGGNLMRQKLQKYFKPQLEDMYKYLNWENLIKIYLKNRETTLQLDWGSENCKLEV